MIEYVLLIKKVYVTGTLFRSYHIYCCHFIYYSLLVNNKILFIQPFCIIDVK